MLIKNPGMVTDSSVISGGGICSLSSFYHLDTKVRNVASNEIGKSSRPYFIAGAGDLVAHVYRLNSKPEGHDYQFNLFRIESSGEASSWLHAEDLRDVVKSCQVLAFSIADEGGTEQHLKNQLLELSGQLQEVTDKWGLSDA